jgi:hypothetical protein
MIVLALALTAAPAMALSHVLLYRTVFAGQEPKSRIKVLAYLVAGVIVAWGLLAVAIFWPLPWPLFALNTGYVVLVNAFLGASYFHFFLLSETALRIRILIEAYAAERSGVPAPLETTAAECDPRTMIGIRINRLLAMGAAREEGGRILACRSPLLLAARLSYACRSLWKVVLFGRSRDTGGADF